MALSPQEMQELAELEELEALEAEEAQHLARVPAAAPKPDQGAGNAFAGGVAQSLTAGYVPQIVGALSAGAGKLQDLIQGEVIDPATGKAIPRTTYLGARDATNRDMQEASAAHPMASLAGNVAGAVMPGGLMAKAAAKGGSAAVRMGRAGGVGAAQGAAYNPGDKEGVMDPAQLGSRAGAATLGALIGGAGRAGTELIGKGVQTGKDIALIKGGGMLRHAKDSIDGAIKNVNDRAIKPLDDKLRALIRGKTVNINPDRLDDGLPGYAGKLREKGLDGQPVGLDIAGGSAPAVPARVPVDAERALRARRTLDTKANYGASKLMDPVAQAKGLDAKAGADHIRRQLNSLDPGVEDIQGQSAEIMALRDALTQKARANPMAAIRRSESTDAGQLVKNIDNLSGATPDQSLERLGQRIDAAADLQLDPRNFFTWSGFAPEIRRTATRAGIKLSEALNYMPEKLAAGGKGVDLRGALTPIATQTLLEKKRGVK